MQVEIQRHVARRLPWVRYHEHPEAGHALPDMDGVGDEIVRELLLGAGEAPQSEPRATVAERAERLVRKLNEQVDIRTYVGGE